MKKLLIIAALLCGTSQAATHYIRDGGTASTSGTGSCTGWATANACDTLPATLVRGDTYCIADGAYGNLNLTTTNSGTTRITIKKAVDGDGTCDQGSDWVSTYGNGQATFGSFSITTGYWTIDGINGGGPSDWNCVNCGFKFSATESNLGGDLFGSPGDPTGIIMRHFELDGLNDNSGDTLKALNIWHTDDLLIEYAYIHDSVCDLISGGGSDGQTFQYSKFARPHQIICHGDLYEWQVANGSNLVFRWNYFEDVVGSYGFGSHGPNIDGYYIYGNIFHWPVIDAVFGNHLVGTLLNSGAVLTNMKFLNNSLYGRFVDDAVDTMNVCIGVLGGSGTGNEVRNNLWVSTANVPLGDQINCGTGNGAASSNSGRWVKGLDEDLGSNPFVNAPAGNFALTGATTAGTTLSSPYNVDMLGNTRGGDGTWDRGALEYGAGTAPNAPSNLRLISWAGWLIGLGLLGGLMQRMRHGAFNDWWRGTRAARIIHSLLRAAADGLGRSKTARQAG